MNENNNTNLDIDITKLQQQVLDEYTKAKKVFDSKISEWLKRLKLYNNQRRDKEAIGDPLLFTVFQTVLAALYDDKLITEWEGREEGDQEVAENLNYLSEYDFDLMEMERINYDWDWDTCFFGRGIVCLSIFSRDKDKMCPMPEVVDPTTFLRDPRAVSINGDALGRNSARFLGREIQMHKYELENDSNYFNIDKIKYTINPPDSLIEKARQERDNAQGREFESSREDIRGNETYDLLEWYTIFEGKKVICSWANDKNLLIRYQELDDDKWSFVDRSLYPISHDWDGVSIPDVTEDKQRARSIIQNLALKTMKADIYPMYIFDENRIKNRNNLNFEFNKFIPVRGDTTTAVSPMNKVNPNLNLYDHILQTLDSASQRATACYSEDTQTLTENGWKYYWEIDKEKIATYNPQTKKIEYHKPLKKLVYKYEGEMYHYYRAKGVDLMVTPEHRIWHRTDSGNGVVGNWSLIPANKIKSQRIEFAVTADWDGVEREYMEIKEIPYQNQTQYNSGDYKFKLDDWVEFLGYIVSEGYIGALEKNRGGYFIQVTQKRKEKIDKIRQCLVRLDIKFKEYFSKSDCCIKFYIFNKTLWYWLKKNIGDFSYNKRVPSEIKILSTRQLKIFFDAYMCGDGNFGKREGEHNGTATTVSSVLADDLQEISLKLGYKTKLTYRESQDPSHLPTYRLDFVFNDRKKDWVTPRIDIKDNLKFEKYNGMVYCFQVPNHLFVTRRNGLISIQGNTPEIQQGVMSEEQRTLGELNLVAARVDTRYSLSAKIFGWSEKAFWRQWYNLYKKHFKSKIDEKIVRISGAFGARWRKLTRENIISEFDPDVKIESRILSEAKKVRKQQMLGNYMNIVMEDPSANRRYGIKKLGKLAGLDKDEIERLLPPTPDELIAEEQNKVLSNNKTVPILPNDNHVVHLEIHTRAAETPAKFAHVEAHKEAIRLKKANPDLFPEEEAEAETGLLPEQRGNVKAEQPQNIPSAVNQVKSIAGEETAPAVSNATNG